MFKPLTITAEREAMEQLRRLYESRGSYAYELQFTWPWMRQLLDAYDAERAANQETLVGYRTIEALLGMLDHSEAVDEDVLIKTVNDKVSKLVTAHQETQAKLESYKENLSAARLELFEVDQKLAETQAIARELLEVIEEVLKDKYIEPSPFQRECYAAIAKAKGVLNA